ncbi:MAG: hypothetical protein Q9220_002817 [cf. Caloplaca sp. 1 TL-2023]
MRSGVAIGPEEQMKESLNAIEHRGPDSRGSWVSADGSVALGSCRLEINDLSPSGNQPFHSADGTVHAVVNGELYDHERIREDMTNRTGYVFQGRSDCEIVIALYEYYGVSFVSHLRGEFAVCLYDSEKRLFFASRDRSGVKPLLWAVLDNRLIIVSEAKALLAYGWQPKWDVRAIKDLAWLTEERMIFEGLRKIRPGYFMTCVGSEFITQRQYWDHDYPDKTVLEKRSVEEMIDGVRSRLLEAVKVRLQADVPVGIHLSGGIDSSVVAGMAKHLVETGQVKSSSHGPRGRLQCLGVAFSKDSGFDESDVAKRTADWLGVDFHVANMTEAELAANFEDAVWFDELTHLDLAFVGKHVLSKVTRDIHLKTVLSGQGSDEIFGGYNHYFPSYLREPDLAWPDIAISEEWRAAENERSLQAQSALWDTGRKSKPSSPLLSPRSLNEAPEWIRYLGIIFPQPDFAAWPTRLGECPADVTIMEDISESARQAMRRKWHPLHSAHYVSNKTVLPNLLLTNLGDKTEMSHSVEGRVPFLDHHLMEYVNGLPPSVKIRPDSDSRTLTEKWILREASKPFITKEVYERKKQIYASPINFPAGGPMHQLMNRLITQQSIEALGFVDWPSTKDLVPQAFEGQNPAMLRRAFVLAQYVVLSQKFGVKCARAPPNHSMQSLPTGPNFIMGSSKHTSRKTPSPTIPRRARSTSSFNYNADHSSISAAIKKPIETMARTKHESKKFAAALDQINVFVTDRLGRRAEIRCSSWVTIGQFKRIAGLKMGIKPEEILLKRQGMRPFKDALTLRDYEISDGSSLDLEVDTTD